MCDAGAYASHKRYSPPQARRSLRWPSSWVQTTACSRHSGWRCLPRTGLHRLRLSSHHRSRTPCCPHQAPLPLDGASGQAQQVVVLGRAAVRVGVGQTIQTPGRERAWSPTPHSCASSCPAPRQQAQKSRPGIVCPARSRCSRSSGRRRAAPPNGCRSPCLCCSALWSRTRAAAAVRQVRKAQAQGA